MNRRVVITGMGAVSPNGVGNAAFSRSILEGRSGVNRISRFDPAEIPVQIAGEVHDFDELAWIEKKERRHVSRVLPLALAAATEALQTSGIETDWGDGNALKRAERAFRAARHQQRNYHRVYVVDRRFRVFGPADSIRTTGFGFERRRRRSDRTRNY